VPGLDPGTYVLQADKSLSDILISEHSAEDVDGRIMSGHDDEGWFWNFPVIPLAFELAFPTD